MPYKDPERQRLALKRDKHRQRLERRKILLQDQKCVDCGNDDSRVLEFHHRDPAEKQFAIAAILSSSWEKILVERERSVTLSVRTATQSDIIRPHNSGEE